MSKNITFLFAICIATTCFAQTETKPFEGVLTYREMKNINQAMSELQFGDSHNGINTYNVCIKGNKILVIDSCKNIKSLFDGDKGILINVYGYLGKGYKKNLEICKDVDKRAKNAIINDTNSRTEINGQPVTLKTIHSEFKERTVMDVAAYVNTNYSMPEFYTNLTSTYDYGGILVKFIQTMTMNPQIDPEFAKYIEKLHNKEKKKKKTKKKGKSTTGLDELEKKAEKAYREHKMYTLMELKDMSFAVDDSVFEITKGISIADADIMDSPTFIDFHKGLIKDNQLYMTEHNLHPTKNNKEVVYDLDAEWDF